MTLQPSFLPHATKLKIKEHPSASQLISLLETNPPATAKEAQELFSLLAARVSGKLRHPLGPFLYSDLNRL